MSAKDFVMSVMCASMDVSYNSPSNSAWRGKKLFASLLLISLALHVAMLLAISNNKRITVEDQQEPVQLNSFSVALEPESSKMMKPDDVANTPHPHLKAISPRPVTTRQHQNKQVEVPPVVESKKAEDVESIVPMQNESPAPLPSQAMSSVNSTAQEQHYLAMIRSLINAHKFYPESARRRGMQGKVLMTFQINPDGSISNINCAGGPLLLQMAAEEALIQAGPFPTDQFPGIEPLKVHYEMAYQLN